MIINLGPVPSDTIKLLHLIRDIGGKQVDSSYLNELTYNKMMFNLIKLYNNLNNPNITDLESVLYTIFTGNEPTTDILFFNYIGDYNAVEEMWRNTVLWLNSFSNLEHISNVGIVNGHLLVSLG